MISLRKLSHLVPIVSAIVFLSAPPPAAAQWMWKDEAGHVIASDQAPPPGTPQSRIMKAPRQRPGGSPSAATSVPDVAKADPPKSVADRELEAKLKAKEQADAAKKADEDANRMQAMKENCASVRSNIVALQSGGRAARFNAQGEKIYIGDDERQAEIAKQQAQANQYCKS